MNPWQLTVSVEEYHPDDHEERVIVELPCRVVRPREAATEMSHPDHYHDDRDETEDLGNKDPAREEPQGPLSLTINPLDTFVLLHDDLLKCGRNGNIIF